MKVTYNWLKEFVKFNYTPNQLAEQLTMLGLEVELLIPVKLFFSGIVVGKILDIKPHPNLPSPYAQGVCSQKLLLCQVSIGKEVLQIVCGAHNISVGDMVPTATIGAVLADNTRITKRNIGRVDSFGMLCSEKELGLSDISNGIFILSNENTNGKILKIGTPLEKALRLDDTVLDINVTPNRSDALSIVGIAREISCVTQNPLKSPTARSFISERGPYTKELISVRIKTTRFCPRYTARVIKDLKIKTSPFWIRYRLGLIGIRPINNVVDITNYVLMELGQPLHAFDYKAIGDSNIIVRTANPGEEIITIDNEKRVLNKDVLVIADSKKPIAIAGVMGGKETEVGDKTTDILLESAYFEPANIRRTVKRFGLATESSYRFERAIDPELAPVASARCIQLILKVAGGNASKGIIDCKYNIPKPQLIKMDASYCNKIIGMDIPIQKVTAILKAVGCKVKRTRDTVNVKPPTWRRDITKKIDLTEEIARTFGYAKIPPAMPEALVRPPGTQKIHEVTKKLHILLTGMGLNEIITYSFINPKDISILRLPEPRSCTHGRDEQRCVKLINPVDRDVCIMRPTLIPGVVNTIVYNINRGNDSIHIFEVGKCFVIQNNDLAPKEDLYLGIGISGKIWDLHWKEPPIMSDFLYLKGIIEGIFKKLFIYNYQFLKTQDPTFHPQKRCAINVGNKRIGIFGEFHPQITKNLDIKDHTRRIYIAELNITDLLELIPSLLQVEKFQPLPKFPAIRRDISIILDKNIEGYDIIRTVKGIGSDIIESIEIFDIYEGHPIPEGKKSIAYAITYRHKEKTLTDEEVDNIHNTIRHKILENVPGEIRK